MFVSKVTYDSQFGMSHLWLMSPLFYQNLPQALVTYVDVMKLYQFIPKSYHLPEGTGRIPSQYGISN
jgi:hypothetical protein